MRQLLSGLLVIGGVAFAQPISVSGNIVMVQDTNGAITNLVGMNNMTILPSHQEQFCRGAYNAARASGLADDFDGVITFSASEMLSDIDNVWQGSPVRSEGTGYGRVDAPWKNTYNSSKIAQCVFMGTLGRTTSFLGGQGPEALPADPEGDWMPSLGIPLPIHSLTGIEMMGHEYGHHWLLGIEFDQNDGRGRQHFIRGFSGGDPMQGTMGSPNQHYSHFADSRSVMYGECITDLGNGSFKVEGCPRKYSQIDQYLMGLRGPNEVAPMMVLEDPTALGQGTDAVAQGRTAGSTTVTNMNRHDIAADEIVRAMGARIPAYPNGMNCWRVAFIVVLEPGQTSLSQAMLDKVKRYEARWSTWFNFATDGRGTMDTRIVGGGCLSMSDAGVPPMPDSGVVDTDAGTVDPMDAGMMTDVDGGVPDSGVVEMMDAGPIDPGPSKEDTRVDTGKIRPGCDCSVESSGVVLFATIITLMRSRRRASSQG